MSGIRKKIVIAFEVFLMVVQFVNLMWMTRFFPMNYAEWIINFVMFVYVFGEVWMSIYRRRRGRTQ